MDKIEYIEEINRLKKELRRVKAQLARANRALKQLKDERGKELSTLSDVSRTVASPLYLEEILQLIVAMTAEVMNSKICSLMLLDEEKGELILRATQSLSDKYRKKPNLKVGQSVSGKVVLEQRPIVVLDVARDKNYMFPEIAKKEGLRSMLCVPMMVKGRIIGVINSYTSKPHRFKKEEIGLLSAVANQAAIAIYNTQMAEAKKDLEDKLETRKLVERAKGILMKKVGLQESDAYRIIQKRSMDSRQSMKEIANEIIENVE